MIRERKEGNEHELTSKDQEKKGLLPGSSSCAYLSLYGTKLC